LYIFEIRILLNTFISLIENKSINSKYCSINNFYCCLTKNLFLNNDFDFFFKRYAKTTKEFFSKNKTKFEIKFVFLLEIISFSLFAKLSTQNDTRIRKKNFALDNVKI